MIYLQFGSIEAQHPIQSTVQHPVIHIHRRIKLTNRPPRPGRLAALRALCDHKRETLGGASSSLIVSDGSGRVLATFAIAIKRDNFGLCI